MLLSPPEHRHRLAVLIDADNIRSQFVQIIIREASALGTITIKRVYGHFGSPAMASFQPLVHDYALSPVHIPPAAAGKNATDMKLAIEAMDILHRRQVDGFCIASSDSDFTALAGRIREDGLKVFGFGEKKASTPYVRSCDRFFYCDLLLDESSQTSAVNRESDKVPAREILAAIEDTSTEDGWSHLAEVGQVLSKRMPDFDPRNYGFKKLSQLVETIPPVEIDRPKGNGGSFVRVRRK